MIQGPDLPWPNLPGPDLPEHIDRKDKYNDKYMEKDKDKGRPRQECRRLVSRLPDEVNKKRKMIRIEFMEDWDTHQGQLRLSEIVERKPDLKMAFLRIH